jgi:hypothetical protein
MRWSTLARSCVLMDNLNKNLKMKSQLSINGMLKDYLVPVTTNNYATEDIYFHRQINSSSVADPDPSDPYVFGHNGSESGGTDPAADPDPSIIKQK